VHEFVIMEVVDALDHTGEVARYFSDIPGP